MLSETALDCEASYGPGSPESYPLGFPSAAEGRVSAAALPRGSVRSSPTPSMTEPPGPPHRVEHAVTFLPGEKPREIECIAEKK